MPKSNKLIISYHITPPSLKLLFLKNTQKILNGKVLFLAKCEATRLQLIIFDIFKPFKNNFCELLEG